MCDRLRSAGRAEQVGTIDPSEPEWAELLLHRPGVTGAGLVALGGAFNSTPPARRRAIELRYVRSVVRGEDMWLLVAPMRAVLARGNIKR